MVDGLMVIVHVFQILHRRKTGTSVDNRHWGESRSLELFLGTASTVVGVRYRSSDLIMIRYHGGWLAPNIYFLGHAGCVQVNGLRIAGASGIYKSHDFKLGASYLHLEFPNLQLVGHTLDSYDQ